MHLTLTELANSLSSEEAAGAASTLGPAELISFGVTLIVALVGAQWLTEFVKGHMSRHDALNEASVSDLRSTQEALNRLASACRRRSQASTAEPSDEEIGDLSDALEVAASFVDAARVVKDARAYIDVSQAFASGDPDTGQDMERAAYRRLVDSIRISRTSTMRQRKSHAKQANKRDQSENRS